MSDKLYCTHCQTFENTKSELEEIEGGKSILRNDNCGCSSLSILYTKELLCKRCNSIYKVAYRKK